MAKFSTGLRDSMMAGQSFKGTMDGGVLHIFGGTAPASADDSEGAAPLLVTLTVNGSGGGLNFDTTASNGALSKAPGELWKGEVAATGNATWFRFVASGDTGASSTTEARVQGTIGAAAADMLIANPQMTELEEFALNYFTVVLPTN